MKIAILTAGNSTDTGGIMSFVCEEAHQLRKRESTELCCVVFMIRSIPSRMLRGLLVLLRKKNVRDFEIFGFGEPSFVKEGVMFHNIWIKEGIASFLIRTRVSHKFYSPKNTKIICDALKDYNYIICHKPQCHSVGHQLYEKYGIPFGAFWHGSELTINTVSSDFYFQNAKIILESAHDNFFVSKALLEIANGITKKGRRRVIYTGPSDIFYRYSPEKKAALRERFGIAQDTIVIAYAGHIIDLKNVMLLPAVFNRVKEKCKDRSFIFWIIGHGNLEIPLNNAMNEKGLAHTMFGNVPPEEMPDYMNCIDILLLISKNEGLGLVCLEAMKCGAMVFGSRVGGIPEAIGESNCIPLNEHFVEDLSELISDSIIKGECIPVYNEKFSWEKAIDSVLESITEVM